MMQKCMWALVVVFNGIYIKFFFSHFKISCQTVDFMCLQNLEYFGFWAMFPMKSIKKALELAMWAIILPPGHPPHPWRGGLRPLRHLPAPSWLLDRPITMCRACYFWLSHLFDGAPSQVTLNSSPKHNNYPWDGQRIGWLKPRTKITFMLFTPSSWALKSDCFCLWWFLRGSPDWHCPRSLCSHWF